MRIITLVKRIFIQTIKDRRTLALIIVAPIIVLSLLYFLFNSTKDTNLKVGLYDQSKVIERSIKDYSNITIINFDDSNNVKDKIIDNNLQAFIYVDRGNIKVTYENSNPSDTSRVKAIIQSSMAKSKLSMLPSNSSNDINEAYIYGDKDLTFFDTINPIFIGFIVFFYVFLIAGVSLLNERNSKTLEKLLTTPIKRYEIVLGYLIGYGIFAVIQTVIIVLFSIYVLGMKVEGSIFLILITNIVIALVALSLGILISTFVNTEFQMMQFIPIVIVPQILFTGILPVSSMANWLQGIAHIIPLYYGANTLRDIMIKGYSLSQISNNLLILIGFTIMISIINVLGLKRYRKI